MEIRKLYNELNFKEYFSLINNHKTYSDFNTLGLYRSIIENSKLTIEEKIVVRDYSNKVFDKTFNFLQIKDPKTYYEVSTLGMELTKGDEENIWRTIILNQQKILNDKKIKHRNFGNYSKHDCGYESCIYNGLMIKQGSFFSEQQICFNTDENKYQKKVKSEKRKLERKMENKIIDSKINLNNASF